MRKPVKEIYKFCPKCASLMQYKSIDRQRVQACQECGFIFWNDPKPVVSIILSKEGKILLLRRANEPLRGYWCLPGGFVRYEETAQEAISRETREEIGFHPNIGRVVGIYRIDNDPRGIHIDMIFEGSCNGDIKLSDEHDQWQYFDASKLPDKIAYKHKEAIGDWFKKEN